jgi:hypothetical protein
MRRQQRGIGELALSCKGGPCCRGCMDKADYTSIPAPGLAVSIAKQEGQLTLTLGRGSLCRNEASLQATPGNSPPSVSIYPISASLSFALIP